MMLGVSLLHPLEIMYSSNAFSTPLEIVPEWYFLPSFNLLRIIQWKVIGVLSMIALIILMLSICLIENLSIYSNPFRRPIMISLSLVYSVYGQWLGEGYVSIQEALPLI